MRLSVVLVLLPVCTVLAWILGATAQETDGKDTILTSPPEIFRQALVDFLLESRRQKFQLQSHHGLHLNDPATSDTEAQRKPFELVNFEFDSDRLTRAAQVNLDQFAAALRDPRVKEALMGEKFSIDGFTDVTGPENYNRDLSERRADAVVNYLTQKGIDRAKLIAKGFGSTPPLVPDPYDAANRRVEIHLAE